MFGTFGNVTFELLTSPQAFRSARKYDYAEHKAAQARPKARVRCRAPLPTRRFRRIRRKRQPRSATATGFHRWAASL